MLTRLMFSSKSGHTWDIPGVRSKGVECLPLFHDARSLVMSLTTSMHLAAFLAAPKV